MQIAYSIDSRKTICKNSYNQDIGTDSVVIIKDGKYKV